MRKAAIYACILFVAQHWSLAQTVTTPGKGSPEISEKATVTSNQPEFVPMTQTERVHHYFRSTFNLTSVATSAAGAGILQWENTPKEWGQGAEGYGKRVGNSYAQHIMRQTMIFGASSVLHEDNRYIACGQSGFGRRLKYAIASTFLARRDDGTRRFSFSRMGGTAGTAFVSRIWQPPSTNAASDGATSFGISMGMQVGFNVGREFLPGVFQRDRR